MRLHRTADDRRAVAGLGSGGMDTVIELAEVTKRHSGDGPPAVERASLTVGAGEAVAGTVTVAGERVDRMSEGALARFRRAQVGMIFQFFNLLDDLTVADNVLLPAQLAGLNASGQTLVLVTHNPDLAAAYAGRVIELTDGRVTSDRRTAVRR
jgi:ABC-type lipoprotein export system ATPase subunit